MGSWKSFVRVRENLNVLKELRDRMFVKHRSGEVSMKVTSSMNDFPPFVLFVG